MSGGADAAALRAWAAALGAWTAGPEAPLPASLLPAAFGLHAPGPPVQQLPWGADAVARLLAGAGLTVEGQWLWQDLAGRPRVVGARA